MSLNNHAERSKKMGKLTLKKSKGEGLTALFILLAAFLVACSEGGGIDDEGDKETTTYVYHGTQTPGDYWRITFSEEDKSFSATNVTQSKSVSGTTKELTGYSEGFTEFTTDDENEKTYGIVIPGATVILAPSPFEWVDHSLPGEPEDLQYVSKHPAIFGISQGSCDDLKKYLPFQFVGVQMPNSTWDSREDWAALSGEITFNNATAKYSIKGKHYTLDGNVTEEFDVTGDCTDGVISFDVGESEVARVSFTPSGLFFVDDPSKGGAVGYISNAPAEIEEVYGKTFLGMRYHSNYGYADGASSPETQPLKGKIAQGGTSMDVEFFSNIAMGESYLWQDDVRISFDEEIVPGMLKGTATDADGTHDAIYIVRKINAEYQVIFISDNWPSYSGYNVFMIEK